MALPWTRDYLMTLVVSIAVVIVIAVHLPNTSSYEYCSREKELCSITSNAVLFGHIVCNPSQIPIIGKFESLYPMTRKIKNYLLRTHNRMRNQLASGWDKDGSKVNFPAASRMRELIWDDELEYLAKVHAKYCYNDHDYCRATVRFPYAGQNLGFWYTDYPKTVFMAIDYSILRWYGEKDLVKNGTDLALKLNSTEDIGHFTLLVNEQVSRVGCAIAYCTKYTKKHSYHVTCDYDMTNLVDVRMYTPSPSNESAVDCEYYNTTKSHVYLHLCANSGAIFKVKGPHSQW